MTFYTCQKSVTRVATRGPPGLLSSRVAITSHQYTITLYTPGHLQILWDVFAKKSADILSFRISFITISNLSKIVLDQFKPVQQSRQQAYYSNIYTVLTGINFNKLLELKTMTKLKILTCLHLNCPESNVLKNQLPRILINEELFSVIGGPHEFNQFSIWEVKADQTDLFEDNEQF